MAFPRGRLDYHSYGSRMHVVYSSAEGTPIMCGAGPKEWPFQYDGDATNSIMLTNIADCDHGGTRQEPTNLWTGKRVVT